MSYHSKLGDFDLYSYFYSLLRQIPAGRVCSYKDLAIALGDPISARAVGEMLTENPDPANTGCFRVVHNDGRVGNYTLPLGTTEKIRKLRNDGIPVYNGKIDNFEKVRFTEFITDFPLKKMAHEQELMAQQVESGEYERSTIGAVDVSYSGREAYAALVWLEGGKLLSRCCVREVKFPYIPTYLSYREGAITVDVLNDFGGVALIDGHGIYHPRFCGIACFVGLERAGVTIGIGKSKLGGLVNKGVITIGSREVCGIIDGRYVSPGNRIGLRSSIELVKSNADCIVLANEAHKAATNFRNLPSGIKSKM